MYFLNFKHSLLFNTRYGCPFIYRCPVARAEESGMTEVNGKSFDVFAIGTMAFEIFTGMSLLREASKWHSLVNWHAQVYPVLQDSLQVWNITVSQENNSLRYEFTVIHSFVNLTEVKFNNCKNMIVSSKQKSNLYFILSYMCPLELPSFLNCMSIIVLFQSFGNCFQIHVLAFLVSIQ